MLSCLLWFVCYLLCVVCCSLFVLVVGCSSVVGRWALVVVCCLVFGVVCCSLLVVRCLAYIVRSSLVVVRCWLLFVVWFDSH